MLSTLVSNLELIRRVPLFSTLTDRRAQSLARAAVKSRFKRTESIVEQGKKSDSLAIMLTGRARVMVTGTHGREASGASGGSSALSSQAAYGHFWKFRFLG
jgi:CRP/FNR family cyclic AMP-dependent transcriptional regulator